MIRWIIGTSLRSRLSLIAVAVIAVGIVRLGTLPVEALPEFMPTRVEVQTEAIGLSAEEVENLITNPMEQEFFNGMRDRWRPSSYQRAPDPLAHDPHLPARVVAAAPSTNFALSRRRPQADTRRLREARQFHRRAVVAFQQL